MAYKIGSSLGMFAAALTILITLDKMWLLLGIIPLHLLIFKIFIRGAIGFLVFFGIGWLIGFILDLKIPQLSEIIKPKFKEEEEKKEKPKEEAIKEEERASPEDVAKVVKTLLQE